MSTHSNILAWRIPPTEESGGLQSRGSQSRTGLKLLSMARQGRGRGKNEQQRNRKKLLGVMAVFSLLLVCMAVKTHCTVDLNMCIMSGVHCIPPSIKLIFEIVPSSCLVKKSKSIRGSVIFHVRLEMQVFLSH